MEYVNRLPYPPTKVARIVYTPGRTIQTIETTGFHNVKANSAKGSIPKAFYVEISGAVGNSNYNGRFRVGKRQANRVISRFLAAFSGSANADSHKSQRDFQPQPTIGPSAALWWVSNSEINPNR